MIKKRGRPKAPVRPKPVSWRPKTDEDRALFLEIGGARWLNRTLEELKAKHANNPA